MKELLVARTETLFRNVERKVLEIRERHARSSGKRSSKNEHHDPRLIILATQNQFVITRAIVNQWFIEEGKFHTFIYKSRLFGHFSIRVSFHIAYFVWLGIKVLYMSEGIMEKSKI